MGYLLLCIVSRHRSRHKHSVFPLSLSLFLQRELQHIFQKEHFGLLHLLPGGTSEQPLNRSRNKCRSSCRMEHGHRSLSKHQFCISELCLLCICLDCIDTLCKAWNIVDVDSELNLLAFVVNLTRSCADHRLATCHRECSL